MSRSVSGRRSRPYFGPLSPQVESTEAGRGNGGKGGKGGKGGGGGGGLVRYEDVLPAFREASWDEALDLVASRFKAIKLEHGPGALLHQVLPLRTALEISPRPIPMSLSS